MDIQEGTSFLVGPGTYYPVGLTIAEAFRWLYQVRLWKMTFTTGNMSASAAYTFDLNPAHNVSASTSGTLEAEAFCGGAALTESDLEYFQSFSGSAGTGSSSDHNRNEGPPADAIISVNASISLFTMTPHMYVYNGLYWPAIVPAAVIRAAGFIATIRERADSYTLQAGGGVSGTMDGKAIEFGWAHTEHVDLSIPLTDSTATADADPDPESASFVIEPILFWAHEFGDIGPIYDILTGEQLQDRNKIIRKNGEYIRLP